MGRFKTQLYILLFFIIGMSGLAAQQLNYVQGELLIKYQPGVETADFVANINSLRSNSITIQASRPIVPTMNIHAISFDHTKYSEFELVDILYQEPDVQIVQLNHLIEKRSTVPNDPFFINQWQYINTGQLPNGVINADLDIDLAWDITTGGVTALGDTIVVCVVDDGLNPNHEDFGSNLWINHAEIPNNSIDDDGNGYIDDDKGWDTYDLDGNPLSTDQADSHGTPVASIVGAKGNNGTGISGVNWDIKIMMVRGGGNEANALASYNYPLVMRQKYNQTNGAEGAFVVATNSSWGSATLHQDDAPLWCAMYDTMGAEGILSAGATKNQNLDIDIVGDLPTGCASEYLMSVTNLSERDEKVTQAGFGLETIDLGAYGDNVFAAKIPNGYDEFSGTSGASPQVAGTIGLLYSAPCDALANLARQNPSAAARLVRDAIFNGVVPNSSLAGKTVTGGRLNVNDAMTQLLGSCGPCPAPFNLQSLASFTNSIQVGWTSNDSILQVEVQYKAAGTTDWTTEVTTGTSYLLMGLDICSSYEVRVRGLCDTELSDYTGIQMITTDGCCDLPLDIEIDQLKENSVTLSWEGVTAATEYAANIRPQAGGAWSLNTTNNTFYEFSGLLPCTAYEIVIQTLCADSASDESDIIVVNIPGCGVCLDLVYCVATGDISEDDFINTFRFDNFENESGDNGGFADFTHMALPHAERDRLYTVSIVPGYTGNPLSEYYAVWIDFNADGSFSNAERVLDINSSDTAGVLADITIPGNAQIGATRMRVGQRFARKPGFCENGSNTYAEYEDYCITIDENSGTNNTGGAPITLEVYPNPVVDQLIIKASDYSISSGHLIIIDQAGRQVRDHQIDLFENEQKSLDISDLSAGIYILRYQVFNQPLIFTRKIVKL